MGVHAQRFLDSLVQRAGGSSRSDQARFRCWASQQLACANMQGVAKLILSVRGHIRQRHDNRDSRVRSVSDIYLPPLPVAPVGSHRERDRAHPQECLSPIQSDSMQLASTRFHLPRTPMADGATN